MKLPIDFKQFSKDPVKGLLFLVLSAVAYLYVDNRMNYTNQIEKCDKKVTELTAKITNLEERLRRSDSTLARAAAKLELINEMGK
jgi:hypothetical protein